jgi:hypothetical protein
MDATATAQYEQAALTLLSLAFEKLKLNSTADLEETFLSCEDPQEAVSHVTFFALKFVCFFSAVISSRLTIKQLKWLINQN